MKKLFISLMLILALLMTSAVAEPEYVPGEVGNALINAAMEAGQMIGESISMNLTINPEALGLAEEDAAALQMLQDFIAALRFTGAVGLTPDGLSVVGEVGYAPADSRDFAAADVAMTVNPDGVAFDSSLLPGQKIVVDYAEALAAAGVPEETIHLLVAALHGDEEALNACAEMLIGELYAALGIPADFDWESAINEVIEIAAPYAGALMNWASTLNLAIEQNVQVEGYPDVDTRITLTITATDVANLIDALVDVLENDEKLASILGDLLSVDASAEEEDELSPMTIADFCQEARGVSAMLREEEVASIGLVASIGIAEKAFYLELGDNLGIVYFGIVSMATENENEYDFGVSLVVADAFDMTCEGLVYADPEDPNHMSVNMDCVVNLNGTPVATVKYIVSSEPFTTENGMPAYGVTVIENVSAQDVFYDEEGNATTEEVAVNTETYGTMQKTENGEAICFDISIHNDALGMPICMNADAAIETVSGMLSGYENLSFTLPGIAQIDFHSDIFSYDYDAAAFAALEPVHVLQLSEEEADALMNTVLENLAAQLEKAVSLMPEGLMEMLSEIVSAF